MRNPSLVANNVKKVVNTWFKSQAGNFNDEGVNVAMKSASKMTKTIYKFRLRCVLCVLQTEIKK